MDAGRSDVFLVCAATIDDTLAPVVLDLRLTAGTIFPDGNTVEMEPSQERQTVLTFPTSTVATSGGFTDV